MKSLARNGERICRLCLIKCDNFELIEGHMKEVLNVLLPNINLFVSEEPVACINCVEIFKKYFDLKAKCLNIHDYIVSFANKGNVKVDLKDVYLSKKENVNNIPKDHNICGFCLDIVKISSGLYLENEEGNNMDKKIIEICLPELNLSIIEKPVICPSCHESLRDCFHFVTNFLTVEDKIKEYCDSLNVINNKCLIDLTDVLQFTSRHILATEEDGITIDVIKEEKLFVDPENVDELVEDNNENFMEWEDQKFDDTLPMPEDVLICEEHDKKSDRIKTEVEFYEEQASEVEQKNENFVEIDVQKFLYNEDIEIKTVQEDFKRFQDAVSEPCSTHTFTHETVSHLLQHTKDKCVEMCDPMHDDTSEAMMYQCKFCSFQTKYKSNLKTHILVHKKPSQLTMYQCQSCPFQTKRKKSISSHVLTHQNQSESKMHHCEFCPFQTRHGHSLKRHLVVHKDPLEVMMYQCGFCSYQTKYKYVIERHNLIHKAPAEGTEVYQCDSCSYQTIKKGALKLHSMVHKDSSEVSMHSCGSCSFETKYKRCLQRHVMLKHEKLPLSEYVFDRPVYQCGSCSYQTLKREALKVHGLVHKDASDVSMHKCESCPYGTKYKRCLQRHIKLRHKKATLNKSINTDSSEELVYQCEFCSYFTIKKKAFKMHDLVHKDPTEVVMYRCEFCSFETKYKRCLRRHIILKHKKPIARVNDIQNVQHVNVGESDMESQTMPI